jgi:CheY-like chemotaxis protein
MAQATRWKLNDTMMRITTRRQYLAVPLLCISCTLARAQDPGAIQPEAAPPPAGAAVVEPTIETDPTVRAALELPRREAADYLRAVIWLIDLGRPELAKPILEELTALQLTDTQRAALIAEFGSGAMLKIARSEELAPAAAQFADACMAAAAAAANDPQRIARLVRELSDPSAAVRLAARNDLAAAGRAGVVATLQALARDRDAEGRAAIADAAATMQPLVVGPLLAMLSTSDPALRGEVESVLARLRVLQAAPFLANSPAAAEQALRAAITRYSAGTPPFALDEANRAEIWHWNDATNSLSSALYSADEVRVIWLARLARALAQLRPDNRDYQRQAWVLGLEAAGVVGAPAVSLTNLDTSLVNDVLADALENDYSHAAVAAADELRQRRDSSVLYTPNSQPSPLANALTHANRRVRFAALQAILVLDPRLPFPGSSRVPEALAWFAKGAGVRRAVVAMPTNLMATDVAGMLSAHGLEAEATNHGREAIDLARELADLELIFVDMDLSGPDVRQVLYELRTAPETGQIPIALLAADGQLPAAQRLADEHERVLAAPRPHTVELLGRYVAALNQLTVRDAASANQRASQAVQAMTWLAKLLPSGHSFYDLHRTAPAIQAALYRPDAARLALPALSQLGTPESQQLLVNFASETTLPNAARAQAAQAFADSVAEFGLLLTTDQIVAQYDRYNASATADSETQQILGDLLDAIESRRDAQRTPAPTGL